LLIEDAKEICVFLADSVSPKCENIRNIIHSIESNTNERKTRLALALEANRDIENALSWWEESSKILCRQISDQNAYSVTFLEAKLNESKSLLILTAEYDSFVNIQYSQRLTKTILQDRVENCIPDLWPQFWFLTKILIFVENFDFCRKFWFLSKILIFVENCDF